MNSEIHTPNAIFCPKCGEVLELKEIDDLETKVKLSEAGYVVGARGDCDCGVSAVLAMKRMPENPTFSLLFNLYKLELPSNNRGKK